MEFIKTYPNQIDKYYCEKIIDMYLSKNLKESKKSDANLNATVKECGLTHSEDPDWLEVQEKILPIVDKNIKTYLSFSPMSVAYSYYFSHMNLMHHEEYKNIPLHYDNEMEIIDNEIQIRNFAVLLYLNGDFDSGGELYFPAQKISIEPKPGLMTIFPTSFMYPHVTVPSIGRDRFVLRFNYFFKKEQLIDTVKGSKSY